MSAPRHLAILLAAAALGGAAGCDGGRPPAAAPPGCEALPAAPERSPSACANRCDDDRDGQVDCEDPDCARIPPCAGAGVCPGAPTAENTRARCANGCSDDGDALIDCEDPECRPFEDLCGARDAGPAQRCGSPLARERGDAACADGCTNDEDLLVDCADPDCAGFAACDGAPVEDARCTSGPHAFAFENTPARCRDGCSNDEDLLVDCADPDCAGQGGCPPSEAGVSRNCPGTGIVLREDALSREGCLDGCSNDLDPFVDCQDPDCAGAPGC